MAFMFLTSLNNCYNVAKSAISTIIKNKEIFKAAKEIEEKQLSECYWRYNFHSAILLSLHIC